MNKSTLLKSAPKEQSLLLIRFPLFSHIKQHQRLILLMVSLAVFILTVSLPTSLIGQSQTFTSTSTFTVPSGIYSITVECWGGGGAGGG
ncbi:MAG: hypothetical protein IPH45_21225, partial [Bacteroidales bacterium]|nr:hypothetical protein [Bacteroidales bacterium]